MTVDEGTRPADRARDAEVEVPDTAPAPAEAAEAADAVAAAAVRRTGPCACLPESTTVAEWPACASCGLPQAPGKDFCGFCGSRWRSL